MSLDRYCRQTILPQIGRSGQEALSGRSAVVAGCGALGCASALLLVRAGVGRLRVIDRDFVETSNLQRQPLYYEEDVASGMPKAAVAAERLRAGNADVRVEGVVADITPANAGELLSGADVIVDAVDNFETRLIINDLALSRGIPWVYGAVIGTYGVMMTILPGEGPCLRCLLPSPPPPGTVDTCATAGIFGPVAQCVAALQASEALKLLLGKRDEAVRGLLQIDVWDGAMSVSQVARRPDCPACSGEYEYLRSSATAETVTLCGQDAVQISFPRREPLSLADLAGRLDGAANVKCNPFMLRFEAEGCELNVFTDGRAIVKGTTDATVARSLYSKYVGA